jgi:RimJ/RimL family protein N-acetyltransferase
MPDKPTLHGTRVTLRRVCESDIDDRTAIGRNSEFEHMCGGDSFGAALFPPREHWERWFESAKAREHEFIIEFGGKCVGSARFHNISSADRSAAYAVGIFDPSLYSRGLGSEVTRLMLEYGFVQLKLHRVELKVLEYNARGIRCYEKCGFRRDGVLRESAFIDRKWCSDVVMSILEDEYL